MKKGLLLLGVWFAVVVMSVSNATAREYTLSDLYQQALENSEKIKYAEENLFIAEMGRFKALSLLIPKVTAFGTYNRFTQDKFSVSGVLIQPEQSGTWGVRADQAFSLSLRELDALIIAGQTITKSEFDLDTAKTDFILMVATYYYDVCIDSVGL